MAQTEREDDNCAAEAATPGGCWAARCVGAVQGKSGTTFAAGSALVGSRQSTKLARDGF